MPFCWFCYQAVHFLTSDCSLSIKLNTFQLFEMKCAREWRKECKNHTRTVNIHMFTNYRHPDGIRFLCSINILMTIWLSQALANQTVNQIIHALDVGKYVFLEKKLLRVELERRVIAKHWKNTNVSLLSVSHEELVKRKSKLTLQSKDPLKT